MVRFTDEELRSILWGLENPSHSNGSTTYETSIRLKVDVQDVKGGKFENFVDRFDAMYNQTIEDNYVEMHTVRIGVLRGIQDSLTSLEETGSVGTPLGFKGKWFTLDDLLNGAYKNTNKDYKVVQLLQIYNEFDTVNTRMTREQRELLIRQNRETPRILAVRTETNKGVVELELLLLKYNGLKENRASVIRYDIQ